MVQVLGVGLMFTALWGLAGLGFGKFEVLGLQDFLGLDLKLWGWRAFGLRD